MIGSREPSGETMPVARAAAMSARRSAPANRGAVASAGPDTENPTARATRKSRRSGSSRSSRCRSRSSAVDGSGLVSRRSHPSSRTARSTWSTYRGLPRARSRTRPTASSASGSPSSSAARSRTSDVDRCCSTRCGRCLPSRSTSPATASERGHGRKATTTCGSVRPHQVREHGDVIVAEVLRIVDQERDALGVDVRTAVFVETADDVHPLGAQCHRELVEQRGLARRLRAR